MIAVEPPSVAALRALLPDARNGAGRIDEAGARQLALWMIESTAPWPAPVGDVLERIAVLHRRNAAAGDPEWPRLRRAAVEQEAQSGSLAYRAVVLAEVAAWPVVGSHATLCEIYHAALECHTRRAIEATGWTAADEARAETQLSILARGDGATIPERHEIPALFARADPVTERRFVTQLEAGNQTTAMFTQSVIDVLADLDWLWLSAK